MRYILQYIQYTTLLFGHKKGNPAMCNNMDRSWGHYAKWNNLDRGR